ncbi:MAG TPA: GreA/GreB family elongation factor [Candidatus Saccharimonadales bacterium]
MIIISGLEPKRYSITPQGVTELRRQLDALKRKRMEVAGEMRDITSQSTDIGALEDSTLTINQNQAAELDGQIDLLERIIGMASIIPRPRRSDAVSLGSRVRLRLGNSEQTYTIVGAVEADPMGGKISDESPLGQCLIGKRVSDLCEIVSPSRQRIAAVITHIE